ncbi:hypothetical protein GCM10023310_69360 [Paenibacillus vulneris]|uniref:Uncharacterized protein n=1 Tax=Paenibacillus vulneris TaxID=1133364 RepID=A0ABW3UIM0_9BACL
MNLINHTNQIYEVEQGDMVEIEKVLYLIVPHPSEEFRYYLPSIDGFAFYGKEGRTLEEIRDIVNENKGKHYSQESFELLLQSR